MEKRQSKNQSSTAAADIAPGSKKKIPALDLMKFMGILIVVFYHCRRIVDTTIATDQSLDQHFLYLIQTLTGPCVPFFFLVNGYLLFDRKLDLKKHLKKTLQFVALALFWSFLTLGLSVWHSDWMEFSWSYVLKHGLLMDTNWFYHLWFMGSMVILYLFFPLMKNVWDHNRTYFYWFLLVCFVITFGNRTLNMAYNCYAWFRYHVNYNPDYNFFSMFNPFQGFDGYIFVYFGLGAIIREHQERFNAILKPWMCILGIVLCTACLYLYGYFMSVTTGVFWQSGDRYGNDVIFSLVRLVCIFRLCFLWKGTGRFAGVIRHISGLTMGIYFIHYVVRNLTLDLFRAYLPVEEYVLRTLLYAIPVFLVSWGLTVLLRKIPGVRSLVG